MGHGRAGQEPAMKWPFFQKKTRSLPVRRLSYQAANLQGIGTRTRQEDSFAFANAMDVTAMRRDGLLAVVADLAGLGKNCPAGSGNAAAQQWRHASCLKKGCTGPALGTAFCSLDAGKGSIASTGIKMSAHSDTPKRYGTECWKHRTLVPDRRRTV